MQRRIVWIAVMMTSLLVSKPPVAAAQEKQESAKQKKAPQSKTQQASLTGCVDEQDGQYVLISEQTRSLIAHLEAEGFPTEGFAKHVGHKVTVRGSSGSTGTDRPVFKVRSVEAISDACGPQQ